MNTKLLTLLVVTSVLLLSAATAARAQYAYSNAVMSLNPAGYWPMHEVEPAAQGDIETNYGSLGLLGTGFYPDWVTGNGLGIQRGAPGALADDPDQCVFFSKYYISGAGAAPIYTNCLYVPHTSPQSTLNPPFTVECWCELTNKTAGQGIWGQFGFSPLNGAGSDLAGTNNFGTPQASSYDGIYFDYNGEFILDGEDNGAQTALPITSEGLSTNVWWYLVVTCDAGTNFTLYTNGVATTATAQPGVGKYSPDYWTPMTIGNCRGYSRAFAGYVDEFAVYTNVITDIAQHYSDGTNAAPVTSYYHDVTNDNPLIYLRMDAPAGAYSPPAVGTWPALNNYGTTNGVVVGSGIYTPGTMPGIVTNPMVNPSGVPFGGVANIFAGLSGVSSFGDAGSAPVYNPTGSNANFTVTALFRGDPCDNRVQSIVGHGTNSWQLSMNTNGCIVFNAGNGNKAAGGIGQAAGDIKTIGVYNDGNWHQVVAVNTTNVISIFVDGALDTNGTPTGIAVTNIIQGNTSDVMIGADPSYTNSPVGVGRQFSGQVCDVAFFTNALTLSQVQALYSSCEVAPFIAKQPINGTVNGGAAFTNTVAAKGSSPFAYQWFTNGVALGGQTNASLILNPVLVSYAGTNYYVVVTNNYGSVTSAVVTLTVNNVPVLGSQFPVTYTNLFALYPGVSPTFSITVSGGALPFYYYWYTNGVLDGAATTNVLQMTNVQIGIFSNYCIVSNSFGLATSEVWTASVIANPPGSGPGGLAPYPQSVLALNPIGYWRMNDTNLDGVDNQQGGAGNNGSGDDGWICHDYVGGNDGIYTNVQLGNPGYNPTTDPSDTSAQFGETGISYVDSLAYGIAGINFGSPANTSVAFTVEAWVSGYEQTSDAGIVTLGYGGGGEQFCLGTATNNLSNNQEAFRFFIRDASGNTHIVTSSIVPAVTGQGPWYHLVGVVDEISNQDVAFYINGALVGTASVTNGSGILASTNLMGIGARTSAAGTNYNDQFLGNINDVAIYNYALSANQVASEYAQSGVAPFLSQPPTNSITVNAGGTFVIPATAVGTPNMTDWWNDVSGGTNIVTGVTNGPILNAPLTVTNVPGGWNNDQLELTVSNAFGETNVFVALTVLTNAPVITENLQPQVLLVSGDSYTYSISVEGSAPFGYQWYNETTPAAGQTNATYTVTAGSVGSSSSYYVVISDVYGSVTSLVSTVTSIAQLTTPYATNLLRFNPVGYWPMHEVEAAAQGDIETNYGSLGLLGTGFYPDWATTNNGFGIERGSPGALAGDPDQSCGFSDTIIVAAGGSAEWTNALYVPHTSPLSTLNPPFTVECWCYPFKTTGGQDVWAQFGFAGLNAGIAGLGAGNYDGIQLIYNGGFYVAGEYNGVQTTFPGSSTLSVSNWYHLVVTCDAGTNITLYTDGNPSATTPAVGQYTPDYWTPLTIANGRGPTRAMTCGLDEFAVYTNVLGAADIAQHYSDGTNVSPATSYYYDVTNDNPVIYLRMDAPAVYTPPIASTWPVLTNYGSAGGSGYYTPGTMPGIVPGPTFNGAPLVGLSGAKVAQLSGVISFADVGYSAAFNPTGPTPFSMSAMFRGNPCDNRCQTIVGHSDNSWRMAINTNGTLQCILGTGSTLNSAGIYNDGNWHQAVDVYTPASNPNATGTNALYVDGVLDTSISTVSTNGIGPGSSLDVMIGADPEYTNNPAGVGEQFAGQVCEVALFANALTAAQVQQLYYATIPVTVNPNPTNIVYSVSNNRLTLTWPLDHTGWQLQTQTNRLSVGISTNWVNVSGSTITNQIVIPINLTNGSVFYRLTY